MEGQGLLDTEVNSNSVSFPTRFFNNGATAD